MAPELKVAPRPRISLWGPESRPWYVICIHTIFNIVHACYLVLKRKDYYQSYRRKMTRYSGLFDQGAVVRKHQSNFSNSYISQQKYFPELLPASLNNFVFQSYKSKPTSRNAQTKTPSRVSAVQVFLYYFPPPPPPTPATPTPIQYVNFNIWKSSTTILWLKQHWMGRAEESHHPYKMKQKLRKLSVVLRTFGQDCFFQ